MPFKASLTKEEKTVVLVLAAQGLTIREIATTIDNKVSYQRIHQICRQNGIDTMGVRRKKAEVAVVKKLEDRYGTFYRDGRIDDNLELFRAAKKRFKAKAKNAGVKFQIEFKDIEWPTHCPMLGMELDYHATKAQENSPSFDCLDPTKGYVKGNVFIISWRANRIKNDGTAEEHRLISNFMLQNGVA